MAPTTPKPKYSAALQEAAESFGIEPSKTDKLLEQFITVDKDLLLIKDKVRLLSEETCNTSVLILGETGTGKELIARALHGNRRGKFVDVNCAGIPDTLLEAEFFGCQAGAFTGAITREGFLEQSRLGTLFLDEIGDMPMLLQCKLLRVLQERKARRLGTTQEYDVSCRIISATNCSLDKFRQDLLYRLAVIKLQLKPLRERPNDVTEILKSKLSSDLINDFLIQDRNFNGNVRELLNSIEEYKLQKKLDCNKVTDNSNS